MQYGQLLPATLAGFALVAAPLRVTDAQGTSPAAGHSAHGSAAARMKGNAKGAARAIHTISVTAHDFSFDAPDTLPAGATTFRLSNSGQDLHQVWLARLPAGKTLDDFARELKQSGEPPRWATDVGGPNVAAPGVTVTATVLLTPGNYALICIIPSADGVAHVRKGMKHAFTVVPPNAGAVMKLPAAAVTLTLDDFKFDLSRPIVAGKQSIRIRNNAAQSHEAVLVKLLPGKTADDFTAWAEKMQGPPPAIPVGGVTGLSSGQENVIEATFEKGRYALVCFLSDVKDGKPHFTHGMTKTFDVE